MATLTIDRRFGKTAGYNIQWCEGKRRRTIYLDGRQYNRKTAERFKDVVERLLYYRWNPDTVPDKMVMYWIQKAPMELQAKLAKAGLIAVSERKTCGQLWDTFLKLKAEMKPSTIENYVRCRAEFLAMFSPTALIETVTSDRLLEWKAADRKSVR
jgi:hypothetical protein